MTKLLSVLNFIIAAGLIWAVGYDLDHDKNEWWGTALLALWAFVSLLSGRVLWRTRASHD